MVFRAKKSLGQHFLLNPSTIDKILRLANITSDDCILEVGPGLGLMTEKLAQKVMQVVAIEKDHHLVQTLQSRLGSYSNVTVIEGDILQVSLPQLLGSSGKKWKVVANLPYNVATEVIFKLFESRSFFHSFYLMVQLEVAKRLVAVPGSKDYSALSIFSQLYSQNKIVMKLPPGAFTPPPKVHSAVVDFRISEDCRFSIHHQPTFEWVVRSAFGQRRKTIWNALRSTREFSEDRINQALKNVGISPSVRAEVLSIEKFVDLANVLSLQT